MNNLEQINKLSATHMQSILSFTTDHDAPFKILITVNIDGVTKTILLVGMVKGVDQRANCYAILNPDHYLAEHATYRLIESESLFKQLVPKHCDSVRYVWTNKLNKDGVSPLRAQYQARKPKPVSYIIH